MHLFYPISHMAMGANPSTPVNTPKLYCYMHCHMYRIMMHQVMPFCWPLSLLSRFSSTPGSKKALPRGRFALRRWGSFFWLHFSQRKSSNPCAWGLFCSRKGGFNSTMGSSLNKLFGKRSKPLRRGQNTWG